MEGVGQVRAERYDGNGYNVKVVIWGVDNTKPSEQLISSIKEKLDPINMEGEGEGIAPIGHRVLVKGATLTSPSVKIKASISSGYSQEEIKNKVSSIINAYFKELNNSWENTESGIKVYSAQIVVRLLELEGIKNIESVTVGGSSNYIVNKDSVLGKCSVELEGI